MRPLRAAGAALVIGVLVAAVTLDEADHTAAVTARDRRPASWGDGYFLMLRDEEGRLFEIAVSKTSWEATDPGDRLPVVLEGNRVSRVGIVVR